MNDTSTPRTRKKRTLTIARKAEPADPSELITDEVAGEQPPIDAPEVKEEERRAHRTLQLGFFTAVVVGVATAAAGSVEGLGALGFAGPLATIIGFYIFGSLQGFVARSDTRQQFADSCYFLGFLLTMVAMLAGFLPAGLLEREITSQGILRHFSMALGATALGLVCRILVLQGGRSLGEIAADVEATLTQYARQVSDEARSIADELTVVRTELQAQRAQVASLVTTDLKQSVEAAFKPIVQSAAEISTSLRTQTEQITSSAQSLQAALNQSAAQISEAGDVRAEASEAAQAAMTSVATALGKFEAQMGELKSKLSEIVTSSTSEIEKMTRAFEQGTALAPSLTPMLETIASNVDAVSQRVDQVKDQSNALAVRVTNAMADDGRLLGGIEDAQGRIVASLDQAGQSARDVINRESDATRQAMEAGRTEMTQLFQGQQQTMRQDAERFAGEISAATDRLSSILNDFAAKIEEARRGAAR